MLLKRSKVIECGYILMDIQIAMIFGLTLILWIYTQWDGVRKLDTDLLPLKVRKKNVIYNISSVFYHCSSS